MNKKEAKTRIQEIFIQTFPELKGETFSFTKKQGDILGWDSFAHMQLASSIEQAFGIELDMQGIIEADSPASFLALVEKKL